MNVMNITVLCLCVSVFYRNRSNLKTVEGFMLLWIVKGIFRIFMFYMNRNFIWVFILVKIRENNKFGGYHDVM